MRVLVGIVGLALIALMLAEFFVAFMLPRRVKRDPRIARGIYRAVWRPWRALGTSLGPVAGDTLLGFFGPFALLLELVVWAGGLMLGFACLEWAGGGSFDFAFSAGTFLSAGFAPLSTWERAIGLWEAATGVGVLFIVIGYLPSVYAAFSRRELAVSQLSNRAGNPPSAGALLRRASERRGWDELGRYLDHAEEWAAEMMETHLSYPLLAYYRSQHVGQNWLAALTTMVDTSAVLIAALEDGSPEAGAADLTFRLGRHALADLAHQIAPGGGGDRTPPTAEELGVLREILADHDLPLVDASEFPRRLEKLRRTYESHTAALSRELALKLPAWLPDEEASRRRRNLPLHLR
jgi:hypothetical protein